MVNFCMVIKILGGWKTHRKIVFWSGGSYADLLTIPPLSPKSF